MRATGEEDPPATVTRQVEAEARDNVDEPRGRKLLCPGEHTHQPGRSGGRIARTFGRRDKERTARRGGSRRCMCPLPATHERPSGGPGRVAAGGGDEGIVPEHDDLCACRDRCQARRRDEFFCERKGARCGAGAGGGSHGRCQCQRGRGRGGQSAERPQIGPDPPQHFADDCGDLVGGDGGGVHRVGPCFRLEKLVTSSTSATTL